MMELEIWEGAWDLPSIDTNCLQILAYAKFSGAPLKLKTTNNPWRSKTGSLPVFKSDKTDNLFTFHDVSSFFKKQSYNADFQLTTRQCSEVHAYAALLKEKLHPALLFNWWCDSKNYIDVIRPLYAKLLPLPLNYIIPGRMQANSCAVVDTVYDAKDLESEKYRHVVLYENAKECFAILSEKLGNNDYFFGNSGTSIDAIVFSYLAPILKAPLPNPVLKNHLAKYANLENFVKRILKNFPSNVDSNSNENKKPKKSNSGDDEEFPNQKRNLVLSVLFGLTAMVGYAFLSGIVSIVEEDSEENYESDNEEEETS